MDTFKFEFTNLNFQYNEFGFPNFKKENYSEENI